MATTQQIRRDLKKTRPTEKLYLACEDIDMSWYAHEVDAAIEIYRRHTNPVEALVEIADTLGRTDEECAVLILDLGLKGRLGIMRVC